MKVLIAEDNPLWRQTLKQNVSNWGYEAVVVDNGQTAWEILQRPDAPRLAVLDWQMPGMDGIDVCRHLKQSDDLPFTYVVMLTSRDEKEDMVAGLDAGADEYLTKPVESRVLKSRLAAAQRIVEVVPPKEWAMPRLPGYDVQKVLGKGAYATVWEAIHTETRKRVALKVIRVDLATEDAFGRFAREIRIAEKLDHPNIARVYDSRIDEKMGYYAMELIDGVTLDRYVKQQPKIAKIIRMVIQVLDGLDYAHRQGVIHRDLKPSNIMITREDVPKLLDFGLARKMFRPDAEAETVTSLDGAVIGTPLFMAPEQARGENDSVDARADIYALGVILYLVVLRKHPHRVNVDDRWQTLREIAEGQIRRPSELRPDLNREMERILLKALAEKPSDRYATAADFAADLKDFLRERAAEAERRKGDSGLGKGTD